MTPNDRQTVLATDNETLSALFDGELRGDAGRFASKRLGHDAAWQDTCGRWQMIGDALRGQSTSAASPDLALRIAVALADEPTPALQALPQPSRPSRWMHRGWAGGALAASVAVALFVARPFQQADAPAPAAAVPAVAQTTTAVPTQATAALEPASPTVEAPAIDDAPAPAVERLAARRIAAARPRPARAGTRSSPRRVAAPVMDVADPQTTLVAAQPVDPFRPPVHGEIVTRPWPRAVLPGSPATGALTASFGNTAESPSFYPFEPRLPTAHSQAASSGPQP